MFSLIRNVLLLLTLISLNSCVNNTESLDEIRSKILEAETSTSHNSELPIKEDKDKTIEKQQRLVILSWNIQDLGKTKTRDHIESIAQLIKGADIIMLQEVVAKDPKGAQAVAKIADELNRTGSKWDYQISNPTKSNSNQKSERYAFLWKTAKVSIVGKAFLDFELQDKISREPYIGNFKTRNGNKEIRLINYHSRKYSDHPELEIVHFLAYLKTPSSPIILGGDFNLNEEHRVWDDFYKLGYKPCLLKTNTTLKRTCVDGDYTSHNIDNFYYPAHQISLSNAGVIDFVKNCNNLTNAREISDHFPVYIEIMIL